MHNKFVSIGRPNALFFINITVLYLVMRRLKLKSINIVNYGFTSNKQKAAIEHEMDENLENNEQSTVKMKTTN